MPFTPPKQGKYEKESYYLRRYKVAKQKYIAQQKAAGKTDSQIAFEERKKHQAESKAAREKQKPKPKEPTASEKAAARRQSITSGVKGLSDLHGALKPRRKN